MLVNSIVPDLDAITSKGNKVTDTNSENIIPITEINRHIYGNYNSLLSVYLLSNSRAPN